MAVQVVKVKRPAQSWSNARPWFAILKGLTVSLKHLFKNLGLFARGRQDFAIHFPEQRLVQPPAMRGMPVLVQMDSGKERCVACGMCEWACPTTCITIFPAETNDEVERYPEIFDIDMSRCMFCGLCEEACPEEAIVMSRQVEIASYSRRGSLWHKQDLLVPVGQLKTRTDYIRRTYER
ncbi:MAG TPA: NADH-quinone oxidoreductase subunit I [Candidatus Binataceae bacterium]|nr:NADH-quinone oxidoreductase subunit I [Candidatus Binataceae bacterium]